jgi:hypothetical protein
MNYPAYTPQPFTGKPPTMEEAGAEDSLYTSGTAAYYQAPIDRRYARQLAGETVQDEASDMEDQDPQNAWSGRELATMAELDDVQGNGVFDPPGAHPNIWPDAGVFAAAYSIPGYHAREQMFAPSEVVDATTGRPVVPVPSGAVALDPAAQIAWIENAQYAPPQQVVRANAEYPVAFKSIANWMQNPQPIAGVGETPAGSDSKKVYMLAAGVGLAAGVLYALTKKKGSRR